ncbi:sigma 54-interacting transcriptional regulator [Vitiosangium sp. GDMCC 1.1324]|uniref:sigma 54-interacting transcriptional regulator n=1 Tax=Vitiosangium sp. (strain GDMCC 1.1324) TaxID=2138576 RepID=UPI000D3BCCC9|nr:sigma-54 dependent transcriptional regulator [Vitiosangium sp. GDMCC 1.1324]PTL80255.1 sigma-54-dependent Fis family transcriptional regulator [Vitiosangium sp. GDMCC 1.1324]
MSRSEPRDSQSPPLVAEVSTAIGQEQRAAASADQVVPVLTLISHPTATRAGERLLLEGVAAGRELSLSRNGPNFTRPGETFGQPLADPFVSRTPLVFSPGEGGRLRLRVGEGGTRVVVDGQLVTNREFTPEELATGVLLELSGRVVVLLHQASRKTRTPGDTLGMVGESPGILRVREHIQRIADLHVPVLVRGETGTGKELVAQAIHQHSPRKGRPFLSVNLGAIPKELAAAELFGAHRGAFTGATRDREGFFRAAQGGTLFLDEVGEAPPEVQVMLLRVLETGELYPVGGHTPIKTDVRLIAATDANLEEHIRDGRFKAPLLHRLAGYEIRLPPLRERREDIGMLFQHFAREALEAIGEAHRLTPGDPYAEPWLPASLAVSLLRHPWPGNIRQLRNLTRQLVIGSRGQPVLQLDPRLAGELEAPGPVPKPSQDAAEPTPKPSTAVARRKSTEVTGDELLSALRQHAWDLKSAADSLGIPRTSIYDLIDKHPNIRRASTLSAEELTSCHRECGGDLDAMVQRLEVSKKALARRLKELGLSARSS